MITRRQFFPSALIATATLLSCNEKRKTSEHTEQTSKPETPLSPYGEWELITNPYINPDEKSRIHISETTLIKRGQRAAIKLTQDPEDPEKYMVHLAVHTGTRKAYALFLINPDIISFGDSAHKRIGTEEKPLRSLGDLEGTWELTQTTLGKQGVSTIEISKNALRFMGNSTKTPQRNTYRSRPIPLTEIATQTKIGNTYLLKPVPRKDYRIDTVMPIRRKGNTITIYPKRCFGEYHKK